MRCEAVKPIRVRKFRLFIINYLNIPFSIVLNIFRLNTELHLEKEWIGINIPWWWWLNVVWIYQIVEEEYRCRYQLQF